MWPRGGLGRGSRKRVVVWPCLGYDDLMIRDGYGPGSGKMTRRHLLLRTYESFSGYLK